MIAVRVSINQSTYSRRRLGFRTMHGIEHHARELKVEERIDQQRFVAVNHQPGVAPAPRAVGLQVAVAAVAEIMQTFAVLPCLRAARHQ